MRWLLGRARLLLERPSAPRGIVVLALLLVSPCLAVGPMGDDYMQMARVDPALRVPGFAYAPLDLFTFVSGEPGQRAILLEQGVFGWWMAPDFKMAFWRPLSSLTHALDHALRPRSRVLAHLHSLAWFAALLVVLAALYRRFHPPWVAALALLLYAIDDARGWVLGWVANRNALVAATLALAALLVHDRARREGWRPGAWLAPLLFGVALLGGESALAVTGYLFAHAVFVDRGTGTLARRLARLWPYAALAAGWLAAYKALGYGTSGGGMYLNPLDEPLPYARALGERLPVLLAAQVGPSLADAWIFLPSAYKLVAWSLAVLTLAAFAALALPLWRRSPVARFWALGMLLSLPPACATLPMDRLLVFAGVGGMATVALVLAAWLERDAPAPAQPARRVARGGAVLALVVLHLVLAPPLLTLRVLAVGFMGRMGDTLEASIPADPSIRAKTLVILSSAAEMTTFPPWMQRQVSGAPRPRRMRVLATCLAELEVTRVDARTLRLRPQQGFLDHAFLRMVRGLSRPFHAGDEVPLSDVRVRVRNVTPDGRPAEADFTFAVPLEDPSLVWRRLAAGGILIPWSPPAVAQSERLTSVAH
jgi:hypothetical protein